MTGDGGVTRRTLLTAGGATALAASAGTGAAQEGGATPSTVRPDFGGWLDGIDGGYRDARGNDEVVVRVGTQGNGGPFAFEPANLWIDPGTTVEFRWASDGHNVLPESQPDGADVTWHEPIENTGFSYTATFETGGLYPYFCEPHRSLGMKGGIAVGDEVPTRTVEVSTGGGEPFQWPGGDVVPVVFGFVFGVGGLAVLSVLGAEFYHDRKERVAELYDTSGPPTEAAATDPAVEVGHDDYDPVGTAALIVGYFLILVAMWVFTYFVEFLNNGPTVVG